MKKKILLGITGSIAAYKAAELTRLLVQNNFDVRVVLTSSAHHFVTPLTLQSLSNNPVYTNQWTDEINHPMLHIELARWADLILIAPASADFMARLALGLADDLLTTLCLAANVPIHIAPAMNQQMFLNIATQQHLTTLKNRNVIIHGPDQGIQACGETGPGRMLEPETLLQLINNRMKSPALKKYKVLITAGPTHEFIDPVRYVGNRSSGKMGYALAEVFAEEGAEVTLISGPTSVAVPAVNKLIKVKSALEMYEAVMQSIKDQDIFIATAAVADYRPEKINADKIKKSEEHIDIRLIKNPDILAQVGQLDKKPFIIGFAAETNNVIENAQKKLLTKKADWIIANKVTPEGPFEAEENELWILKKDGQQLHYPKNLKISLAQMLKKAIINDLEQVIPIVPA